MWHAAQGSIEVPTFPKTRRPPVSFLLIAYNQEQFIREAIAGAFAQTYTPLEIILSDDCSPDLTFEIMQEMAAAYSGPHKVILNRNSRNLGIGGHVNRGMELANGEWIVIAAGDDISLSHRVERIYQTFSSNSNLMAVFSDMEEIDVNGNIIRTVNAHPPANCDHPVECCRNMLRGITGASNSWNRKIFDVFGPMLPDVVFEDRVIALRAALLGRIGHIPESLVRYRRHEGNTVTMFHSNEVRQTIRITECFLAAYRSAEQDLATYVSKVDPTFSKAIKCRRIIRRRIRKLQAYLKIYSGNASKMAIGLLELILFGGSLLGGIRACREGAKR